MSTVQHKTSGIQLILVGVLVVMLDWHVSTPMGYADPTAPPTGVYRCWSGGFDHLPAGRLTLEPKGHYESERHGGGGSYSFLPGTSEIKFLDGDFHYWEDRGVYQRTHAPSAVPASATEGATGSATQPDEARERIVIMPEGATEAPGTERPGKFEYCYREGEARGGDTKSR